MKFETVIQNILRDTISGLRDLFYPPRCLVCGAWEKKWLCEGCIYEIDDSPLPFCSKCMREFSSLPEMCNCHPSAFTFSLGYYEGPLKEAIKGLKYRRRLILAKILGELLAAKFLSFFSPSSIDIILPVPLHREKLLSRGFNQSGKLAHTLSRKTLIKYDSSVLERIRNTQSQVSLSTDKRKNNVTGAFRVIKPEIVAYKNVLLLDDVFTTGATSGECSKVILEAGAKRVYVLVLALSKKLFLLEKEFKNNN